MPGAFGTNVADKSDFNDSSPQWQRAIREPARDDMQKPDSADSAPGAPEIGAPVSKDREVLSAPDAASAESCDALLLQAATLVTRLREWTERARKDDTGSVGDCADGALEA